MAVNVIAAATFLSASGLACVAVAFSRPSDGSTSPRECTLPTGKDNTPCVRTTVRVRRVVSQSRNRIVAGTSIDRFNVGRLELSVTCLGHGAGSDEPPSRPSHL